MGHGNQQRIGGIGAASKSQPAGSESQVGHLGRYSVVVVPVGSVGKLTSWKTTLEAPSVGILERVANWFTGHLNREKNAALIELIRSGKAQVTAEKEDLNRVHVECRLQAFKDIISGVTKATYEEKLEACKAMEACISDVMKFEKEVLNAPPASIGDKKVDDKLNTVAEVLITVSGSWGEETTKTYITRLLEPASRELGISVSDLAEDLNRKIVERGGAESLTKMVASVGLRSQSQPALGHKTKKAINQPYVPSKEIKATLSEALESHRNVYTSFFQTERFHKEKEALSNAIWGLMTKNISSEKK